MHVLRAAAVAVMLLGMSACSGSTTGSKILGAGTSLGQCQPGTQVQLAQPTQGQTVTQPVGGVFIVANGVNNILYQSYQDWWLVAQDSSGNVVTGLRLVLIPSANAPSVPQPYPSNTYYFSQFGGLLTGTTYTIFLTVSGCQGENVGSFST